jgi:hypothetical protein
MLSRQLRPSYGLELSIPRECSICRTQLAVSFHSYTKLREQEKSTPPSSEPSSTSAKTVSSTRRQRTAQAFNSIQNLQRKPVGLRGGQFLGGSSPGLKVRIAELRLGTHKLLTLIRIIPRPPSKIPLRDSNSQSKEWHMAGPTRLKSVPNLDPKSQE